MQVMPRTISAQGQGRRHKNPSISDIKMGWVGGRGRVGSSLNYLGLLTLANKLANSTRNTYIWCLSENLEVGLNLDNV